MLYTTAGSKYITPTLFEASNILNLYQIESFGYETLLDVSNLASGGEVLQISRDIRPFARKSWSGDDRSDDNALVKNYLEALNMIELIIDWDAIPGSTPVLKASFFLKMVENSSNMNYSSLAKISRALEAESEMTQEVRTLALSKSSDSDKKDDEAPGNAAGEAHYALQKIADIKEIMCSEVLYKVARNLDHCVPLQTMKDIKFKPDSDGDCFRIRSIYDIDEMNKMPQSEYVHNRLYSLYRMINQESIIREKGFYSVKKQLLYILLDVSGSMSDEGSIRIQKAGGIVLNRLSAVIRGEAELHLCPFDEGIHREIEIKSEEDARSAMEYVRGNHYSGGGTNIPKAIKHAISRIHKISAANDGLGKPDILIITDGQCSSSGMPTVSELLKDKIKIHAFLVSSPSDSCSIEWGSIAKKTGGIALAI